MESSIVHCSRFSVISVRVRCRRCTGSVYTRSRFRQSIVSFCKSSQQPKNRGHVPHCRSSGGRRILAYSLRRWRLVHKVHLERWTWIFWHFLCRNRLGSASRDSSRTLSYLPLWNPKDSTGGLRECLFLHSGLGAIQYCRFLCSRLPSTVGKASGITVRICTAQARLRSVPIKIQRL